MRSQQPCVRALPWAGSAPELLRMSPVALLLWRHVLRRNPADPGWSDRDPFIVAHPQGAALQRALLQLLEGCPLPVIANQAPQSAAHTPEELLARAVGLAAAEQMLARQFNRPGHTLIDHWTYVLAEARSLSDGASRELCVRAARGGLRKLIVFCEYRALPAPAQWHVPEPVDAANPHAVASALGAAHREPARPTLIRYYLEGTPAGTLDAAAISREAAQARHEIALRGAALAHQWQRELRLYAAAHPHLAAEFRRRKRGALPLDWSLRLTGLLQTIAQQPAHRRSESAAALTLATLKAALPELTDSSTDLALASGLGGHAALLPYSLLSQQRIADALPAMRRAAALQRRAIFAFVLPAMLGYREHPLHCSCPDVQHLHAVTGLDVWQCADELEEVWAWRAAIERCDGPSALLLRHGHVATSRRACGDADPSKGGYVASEAAGELLAILVAHGAELHDALAAQRILDGRGIATRVVSLPCHSAFTRQLSGYRQRILPREVPHAHVHHIGNRCLEQSPAHPTGTRRGQTDAAHQLVAAVEARLAATAPSAAQSALLEV